MTSPDIYQLKIVLNGIRPPIWRRLLVPANHTFWDLHVYIQDSFDWDDSHLHEFSAIYQDKSSQYIGLPEMLQDIYEMKNGINQATTTLQDIMLSEHLKHIEYIYDFGDWWEHRITLEKILPHDPKEIYPQAIGGRRRSPPEDCGGESGYAELLDALQDPKHPQRKEITKWIGATSLDQLPPDTFDPQNVIFRNTQTELKRLRDQMKDEIW